MSANFIMGGGAQSLRLSQHPWSQQGPPRRPQSLRIMAWVGAELETVHELMVVVVAERETLLKILVKSSQSLRLSHNSW